MLMRRRAFTFILVGAAAGCGGEAAQPVARRAHLLQLISGANQSGYVKTRAPLPLVVRVVDSSGAPVAGVTIGWGALRGGAFDAPNNTTGSDGIARNYYTFAPTPGGSGIALYPDSLTSPFTVWSSMAARWGPATRIAAPDSVAPVAAGGSLYFGATIFDAEGHEISGEPVTWRVSVAGREVRTLHDTTDQAGDSRISFRSDTAGSVAVTIASDAAPVYKTITSRIDGGPPVSLSIVQFPEPYALMGTAVRLRPRVLVRDALGNAVQGVVTTFTSSIPADQLVGATTRTDASGIAELQGWTLNDVYGDHQLSVSAGGLSTSVVVEASYLPTWTYTVWPSFRTQTVGGTSLVSLRVARALPSPTVFTLAATAPDVLRPTTPSVTLPQGSIETTFAVTALSPGTGSVRISAANFDTSMTAFTVEAPRPPRFSLPYVVEGMQSDGAVSVNNNQITPSFTFTSHDPARLLVSTSQLSMGTRTVTSQFRDVWLQAIEGATGRVAITADVPGFGTVTDSVTILRRGINLADVPTSTPAGRDWPIMANLGPALPDSSNLSSGGPGIRYGGPPVVVTLTSSDPNVATLGAPGMQEGAVLTLTISPLFYSVRDIVVHARSAGTVTITARAAGVLTTRAATKQVTVTP